MLADLLDHVAGAIDRATGARTYYECRDCGTSVGDGASTCPVCGSREIAGVELG